MDALLDFAGEGGETMLVLVAIAVAAAVLLLGGALSAARSGGALGRRIERLQQQHGPNRMAKAQVAIRRNDSGRLSGFDRVLGPWLPRRSMLEARLARTGRKLTISHYLLAVVAVALAIVAVSHFLFGVSIEVSLLVGVAFGLLIPHLAVGSMGARRIRKFITLFPEAIDLMVRGLRSGLPISESISNAAREVADPVGTEFQRIDQSVRLGQSLEEALWDAAKLIDTPEFKFFIISLSVQRETGGNLAETLDNLSDILRRRRQMKLKIRALSSEARASAYIIGSLPFVMFGVLMLTSPDYVMDLFNDPRGLFMVGVGLFSMTIGVLVMAKMVRFEI